MAERKGRNRSFVLISSTSEEEEEDEKSQDESESQSEDEEEQSQQESESESEEDDHDEDDDYSVDDDEDEDEDIVQEISDSISCDDDDDADGDENESDEEDYKSSPIQAKSICEKVVCLLQERRDLQQKLSLNECKAYLREHGLRLSGTKAECIERIKEHWRIKDGNGEAIYPRSSFNINCTGDVCKGDVVLFSQKVYEKFDKVTRTGNLLGKRTIAGRIVKESYGAAKQQHTFTVEVLWSKGLKKLPPLFPLLVKGRNLYKLKTYRQRWKNEAERSKVLDEKHKRGAAARLRRAMKKSKNTSHTNAGTKRQNDFNHNPSRKKQRTKPDKGKHVDRFKKAPGTKQQHQSRRKPSQTKQQPKPDKGKSTNKHIKAPVRNSKSNNHRHETHQIRNPNFKKHQSFTHPNEYHTFPSHSYAPPYIQHHRAPLSFLSSDLTSTSSMMISPQFRPYAILPTVPLYEPRGSNQGTYPHHPYVGPGYECEPRNLDRFPRSVNVNRPLHPFPVRREMPEQRHYGFWRH